MVSAALLVRDHGWRVPAQVGDECFAEIEEVFRDRLVPAVVERPVLEDEEQRAALAGAKLDRPRCATRGEGGSELHGLSRVLESAHQGVVRRPAEVDRAPLELDDDLMEKHRHGGDGRRTVRQRLEPKWANPGVTSVRSIVCPLRSIVTLSAPTTSPVEQPTRSACSTTSAHDDVAAREVGRRPMTDGATNTATRAAKSAKQPRMIEPPNRMNNAGNVKDERCTPPVPEALANRIVREDGLRVRSPQLRRRDAARIRR